MIQPLTAGVREGRRTVFDSKPVSTIDLQSRYLDKTVCAGILSHAMNRLHASLPPFKISDESQ